MRISLHTHSRGPSLPPQGSPPGDWLFLTVIGWKILLATCSEAPVSSPTDHSSSAHGDRSPSLRNQARRLFHCCKTQPFTTGPWNQQHYRISVPCKRVGRSLLLISHMHVLKLCMLAHITIIKVMCAAWTLIDWLRQIGVIRFNTWVSSPSTNKPARSCDPTILL